MKVLDLFSGIGGFSLGLERAGMQTIAFCEIEPYCQKVLRKHWPDIPIYEDVRNVTRERLNADGIFPDIITGGFPCQDISVAGKQAGINGEMSGLWSECARILGEFRPRYAIFENVTALLSGERGEWFQQVLWDISEVGYDAEWHCIRGTDANIPQSRPRVWITTYPARHSREQILHKNAFDVARDNAGMDESSRHNANTNNESHRTSAMSILVNQEWPEVFNRGGSRGNERLSASMDRYKGIGNTVIPQIPEIIGRAIMEAEHDR